MKMFISALLSLFLFTSAANALECDSNTTEKEFFEHVYERGWVVYTLTESGTEKLLSWVNTTREKRGFEPFSKGTKFYFANTRVNTTGIVYMFEGCVVDGTAIEIPSSESAKSFQEIGITSEDIIPYIIKEGEDA